jgi:Clp amino terminal domain, pathogenicity island component
MKGMKHFCIGFAVAAGLTLGAAAGASAQGKSPVTRARTTPMSHPTSSNPSNPSMPANGAAKSNTSDSFKGIATKLGTTPEALQTAFETARQANPKLTRGQFVAANMLAHNLGSKNSAITTEAILSGLQGGKSIGQTLQGLGLSEKDAEAAERQARRDAAAAQKPATPDAAPKPATP